MLIFAILLVVLLAVVVGALWLGAYRPGPRLAMPVITDPAAPRLAPGQRLKLLSWNIQYLAGKGYVFWYDELDGSGPDTRPAPDAVIRTADQVARLIREEKPDLVLLQEVDEGARRTGQLDQTKLLLDRLGDAYPCRAETFYWKAAFVPDSHLMGSVGMKLVVLSRYQLATAVRHALPLPHWPWYERPFQIQRALLEVRLPLTDGRELAILNTHLCAFAQGDDTMARQVRFLRDLCRTLDREGVPWLLGGDFNLLPGRTQFDDLPPAEQAYYFYDTELAELLDLYRSVPARSDALGPDRARWYTHFPNSRNAGAPDRTIDYIFLSAPLELAAPRVRHEGALDLSDHLPVLAQVTLPVAPDAPGR
jgi:endonuclease/exonuclease/phosphatase family metal-dependent hydrolase